MAIIYGHTRMNSRGLRAGLGPKKTSFELVSSVFT